MIDCKPLTAWINCQYAMHSDSKVIILITGMIDFTQMRKEVLITTSFYDIRTNMKKFTHSDTLKVCHSLEFTILK